MSWMVCDLLLTVMFTNTPVEKGIDIMYEALIKAGMDFNVADELEKLILTCVRRNFCQFDQ